MLGTRRHAAIGTGRGRRPELARPAPNARWQLEPVELQQPLQRFHVAREPACPASDISGTAFGLLPFLAAGQTHETGAYKKIINAGLYYSMEAETRWQLCRMAPTMYEHGLASIALCECYGMTGD